MLTNELPEYVRFRQSGKTHAAAVKALGASPYLRALLVLRLTDNPIHGPDAAALAASPLGKRLNVLELPGLPPNGASDPIPF